jgi:hypothetical protein
VTLVAEFAVTTTATPPMVIVEPAKFVPVKVTVPPLVVVAVRGEIPLTNGIDGIAGDAFDGVWL